MRLLVMCADVGSVRTKNFGWASASPGAAVERHPQGSSITAMGGVLCEALLEARPVALGFECPLSVPVPRNELDLGRARVGDGNRSWSASGGASVLATGLVELAWVLRLVQESCPGVRAHTDWPTFNASGSGLFLWEAFVTAAAKGTTHEDDAAIAVSAFIRALPDPVAHDAVTVDSPLSLVGAAAMWAGLPMDRADLAQPVLTIKAVPSI